MKCPNHLTRNAAGYCSVCGTFFCEDCLHHHEGNNYCPKHYKPIEEKLNQSKRTEEARKRHGRHHLLVHYRNGTKVQGTSRSLSLKEAGFFLECEDDRGVSTGESVRISFADIKMICNVKSYDGKFDQNERYQEYAPGGSRLVVKFIDGEVAEGITLQAYNPNVPRFYLIPHDLESNNINILVESSAVEKTFTPEEYRSHLQQQKEEKKAQRHQAVVAEKEAELGQNESMGDFYFETHNYDGALSEYKLAHKEFPGSPRVRKKMVVATVNIGIQHIKAREYPKALEYMKKALELEPENPHALKKTKQLNHIIKKTERRMREYQEQRQRQQGES